MKFKFLYSVSALLFASLLFMGSSTGPASTGRGDRSGVSSNCAQCHGGTSANASITIQLVDANTNAVTQYVGGQSYTVRVVLAGGSVYGFNSRVVAAGNSNDMGTLSMPSSNAKITALPSANVAEQTAASSSGIFSYQWTAPAAGAGNVRIFAAGIAANRDGNDNSADFHVEATLAISENTGVAVENIAIQSLNLYPNPTQYLLNVSAYLTQAADMQIDIVTLDGKIAQQSQQYLSAGEQQIQLSVANLPAGVYQFRMNDGKNKTSKLFYKF